MQAPQRTVRLAADADNEYEVMQHDGDDEDEAMFEFDDEEEAQEYERGQAALAKELAAKAAAENGGASASSAPSVPVTVDGTAAAAAAAAAAPGVGGIATVVKVAMTATGGDAPGEEVRVQVGLDVFDRYVPHLNANKAESLPESGNITSEDLVSPAAAAASNGTSSSSSSSAAAAPAAASSSGVARMAEEDEDDSDAESADADADASGADLVLTGDLELDQRTLAGLMAGKDAPMAAVEEESSSDDEDDEEDLQLRAAAAKLEDIGSDEEADTGTRGVYTKNELKPDQIAAPAEFTVGAADELVAVGRISSVVDRMMVVESGLCLSSSGRKALDIGSAICLADRTPVGRVEEVMGLVSEPYYAVRLLASTDASRLPNPDASDDEGEEGSSSLAGEEATMVYSVPTLSSFASVDSRPPTDASNMHDEEVAEDEQEFSDDEKEQEAKAARKNARKKNAMEKRKDAAAAAAADGTASAAAAGVLPTGRPIIKAKRNNRLSGGEQPAPTGAAPAPAGAASSAAVPAAVPAFNPTPAVGGGLLSSPFVPAPVSAPAANAPLLPMPGSVPQQPFNPYGQGAAQPFVFSPGAATPQQQQQQQQQHAHAHAQQAQYGYYPQQQQQHAYGAPYAQQAHPYAAYYAQQQQQQQHPNGPYAYAQQGQYPQQQAYGQYAPQPVAGGFAGWGAQNLAGGYAQQQHMYAQQPYGAAYPPNPYAQQQQQQPQAPQQPQQAAGAAPVAQPGSAPPQ